MGKKVSFGDYFQQVCHRLVKKHSWDDPYGSLAPMWDQEGRMLTIIYQGYRKRRTILQTAKAVDKANLEIG